MGGQGLRRAAPCRSGCRGPTNRKSAPTCCCCQYPHTADYSSRPTGTPTRAAKRDEGGHTRTHTSNARARTHVHTQTHTYGYEALAVYKSAGPGWFRHAVLLPVPSPMPPVAAKESIETIMRYATRQRRRRSVSHRQTAVENLFNQLRG